MRPGDDDLKQGDRVLVDQFKPTDKVDVIGVSKGRGFAGVIKRHHFQGGPGSRTDRCSIARLDRSERPAFRRACFREPAWPATWATQQVTVRNLEVVDVVAEDNVLVVKGAVPGSQRRLCAGEKGEEVTKHAECRCCRFE